MGPEERNGRQGWIVISDKAARIVGYATISVLPYTGPVSGDNLAIISLIDQCHLKYRFYGSRRICGWLMD
jgi:hypothetical protein